MLISKCPLRRPWLDTLRRQVGGSSLQTRERGIHLLHVVASGRGCLLRKGFINKTVWAPSLGTLQKATDVSRHGWGTEERQSEGWARRPTPSPQSRHEPHWQPLQYPTPPAHGHPESKTCRLRVSSRTLFLLLCARGQQEQQQAHQQERVSLTLSTFPTCTLAA